MTVIFHTIDQVQAALDSDDLDPDVREHLTGRLASMQRLAAGHNPFARLPVTDDEEPF
jgi:hypothetical protein